MDINQLAGQRCEVSGDVLRFLSLTCSPTKAAKVGLSQGPGNEPPLRDLLGSGLDPLTWPVHLVTEKSKLCVRLFARASRPQTCPWRLPCIFKVEFNACVYVFGFHGTQALLSLPKKWRIYTLHPHTIRWLPRNSSSALQLCISLKQRNLISLQQNLVKSCKGKKWQSPGHRNVSFWAGDLYVAI